MARARVLHITNGDHAAQRLAAVGIEGEFLPWRDALHEGPVRAGLPLRALSLERAQFLAVEGWGDEAALRRSFEARDALLATAGTREEIVLWFEQDLYDQLQLLQVLDALGLDPVVRGRVRLVLHAGTIGAGLTPELVAMLHERRRPLKPERFQRAAQVFAAFRAPSPEPLAAQAAGGLDDFPGLVVAIRRHLQEYPWLKGGLSRTERQILEACATRPIGATLAYQLAHHRAEERAFMGDTVFAWHLRRLARSPAPLLTVEGPPGLALEGTALAATELGRAVLAGEIDAVQARGLERWLGGVHLSGRHAPWRWDPSREALRAMPA
ncbi:MAG: DUF1835 domain-containing protein [Acidobacteria bacterium]|nr:DUF1835 domain-containing protein [Acidobacteriota bacterium]